MSDQYNIQCPSCEHEFNVEDAIAARIKTGYDSSVKAKEAQLKADFESKTSKLREREEKLRKSEEDQEKLLQVKLKEHEAVLVKKIEDKFNSQFEVKLKSLQEENESKSFELTEFKKKELDLIKRERVMNEAKENLELEFEKKMIKERESIKTQLAKSLDEKKALEMQENEILIGQLKAQIDDMKKKTDQGSMQVQGEAQELLLEQFLRERYPIDVVEEVPKGINGADCIQKIRNEFGMECGSIVYESKRTKAFSPSWITKLKEDTLRVKGNISVLVTETLPNGIKGMGLYEGVWVTDFTSLSHLSLILRFAIIREYQAIEHQENKGDKMQTLYEYMTSDEFRMQLMNIIEGFSVMKDNLERQKRSMNAHWKKQDKEIDKVVESTVNMYGSVRGIAGSAVKEIKQLELDNDE